MTRGNVKDITQRKNRREMKEGEKLQTITQLVRRNIYKGINKDSSPKIALFQLEHKSYIFKDLLVFHRKKKAIRHWNNTRKNSRITIFG